MDGPLRSISWVSAKAGQQDADVDRVNALKPTHKPPTARSQSVRSGNSELPKPKIPTSLARRLLFPNLPASLPLPVLLTLGLDPDDPALTSLNDELYDFLALALRAFVQTWWGLLTPRDRDFLPHMTNVLSHAIKDVEQRASNADFNNLLLRQIPALLDLHINDYHTAAARMDTSFANVSPPLTVTDIFHLLQPHVAVQSGPDNGSPIISAVYLRQLVDNVLKLSLPLEDWESEAERFIVREIVAVVVLGGVLKRAAQPWFLQQLILGLLKPCQTIQPESTELRMPSLQSIVIFVLSAMQTISGLALAIISALQSIVALTQAANRSYEHQTRFATKPSISVETSHERSISDSEELAPIPSASTSDYRIHQDVLAPWLKFSGSLLQAEKRLAAIAVIYLLRLADKLSQPWLERLVPFVLSQAASPLFFTRIIQTGKRSLFPNDGWPAPPPAEPTIEEQLLIREQLESRLGELCPPWITHVLLGGSRGACAATIKQALDPFSKSAEINSHLLIILLDLVVSTLWPELKAM